LKPDFFILILKNLLTKKDMNFHDLPSSDREDDDFVPPVPSQKRLQIPKKSFSYPRGATSKRSGARRAASLAVLTKKVAEHMIIMVQVYVPQEALDLLYIFVPTVPVKYANILPRIVDGGKTVELRFNYSRHVFGQIQQVISASKTLNLGLEKELKRIRSSRTVDPEGDLFTQLKIDLPFQCEQQFYPERLISGGASSSGYQTLLGTNMDGNPFPIFQMCLCRVKDG